MSVNLPIQPTLPFPLLFVHMSVLYSVCLFLPWKQVHLYHFSRLHIYALIYDMFF